MADRKIVIFQVFKQYFKYSNSVTDSVMKPLGVLRNMSKIDHCNFSKKILTHQLFPQKNSISDVLQVSDYAYETSHNRTLTLAYTVHTFPNQTI